MSDQYIGEIRMFGGNFAPKGWAFCDGQLLSISQNDALYSLLGTTYGGDGTTTFGLPDLRGRVPLHMGTSQSGTAYVLGEIAGAETVTLTVPQLPSHSHPFSASSDAASAGTPVGNVTAEAATLNIYADGSAPSTPLFTGALSTVGGGQPHDNIMPFLAMNFIIALEGLYPPRA